MADTAVNGDGVKTDPMKLTTAQLLREIQILKESATTDVDSVRKDVTALSKFQHDIPA
jgi:hypothetical protein